MTDMDRYERLSRESPYVVPRRAVTLMAENARLPQDMARNIRRPAGWRPFRVGTFHAHLIMVHSKPPVARRPA